MYHGTKQYRKQLDLSITLLFQREHPKPIYDLFIDIKYNFKPTIKGKGSVIFLHIAKGKYLPTKGCVAIKKKDFLRILPLIKRDTKISIV